MKRDEIFLVLTELFHDVFDDDSIMPHDTMTANDVEAWDSLSHIRLIVAVEAKFGIQFTTIEMNDLENVGQFVDLIVHKLEKSN